MGLRNHKKAIQIASAIMIAIFGISMLVTGILFLKNNVFGAANHREVIATVNGTKIYRDDFEREVYSLKNQLKEINQQKIQQLSQVGVSADNIKDVPDNIINEYVLQLIINKEVLLSSAKELGIKISNATVNQDFESYQKQSKLGRKEFAHHLKKK